MDILAVQQRYIDAGYQFQEHIYNDGKTRIGELINCSIKFAKTKDPHVFSTPGSVLGDFGWGRYSRMECWRFAAEYLDEIEFKNDVISKPEDAQGG